VVPIFDLFFVWEEMQYGQPPNINMVHWDKPRNKGEDLTSLVCSNILFWSGGGELVAFEKLREHL